MKDTIMITTPDHVELEFELAGLGSRAAALGIDLALTMLILITMALLLMMGGLSFSLMPTWLLGLLILLAFVLKWGYFVLFETWWKGQTPGKRALGIRVVRDNGLPIGMHQAAIRNFLRLADMLPPPGYILGGIVMASNEPGKRLGDMAAGTIVTRERYVVVAEAEHRMSAQWSARLERGESRHAIMLPDSQVSIQKLALIKRFLERAASMEQVNRDQLAWQLAEPYLTTFELEPTVLREQADWPQRCEEVLSKVVTLAEEPSTDAEDEAQLAESSARKSKIWAEFGQRVERLLRGGPRALLALTQDELNQLISHYRGVVADLARARGMGADTLTLKRLNQLACSGHNLLYGAYAARPRATQPAAWLWAFAQQVRAQHWAVSLSAFLFFTPAVISYVALQFHPELAYDIVAESFLEFEPASAENIHDIPKITRPIAATTIMTNNLQVTLLLFGLGLTLGLGTAFILIFNGVHLGAVAGWMALSGNSKALWGWIMPHGGTELLAIVLAGAAGFVLGRALIAPGRKKRTTALREVAQSALSIELGCMVMLVIAGLIEGFVSPSQITYTARIAVLVISLVFWSTYLILGGRKQRREY